MEILDCLYDGRTKCWSILTTIRLADYLGMVENAHNNEGSLEGQRAVLKTTSARRIRERMHSDIFNGAILPPVVLGKIVAKKSLPLDLFSKNNPDERIIYAKTQEEQLRDFLMSNESEISIIDGMQRTAVYRELHQEIQNRPIRVEFWVSVDLTSIIYRMLVLNTGQIPWTVEQQINVVYKQLIREIENNTSIGRVIQINESGRRTQAGHYQAKDLVSLYIAFSNQKIDSDPKMTIAEEFAKQDLIEAISEPHFQNYFYKAIDLMCRLDEATYISSRNLEVKSIFDSQTARIGFMVAASIQILGKNGRGDKSDQEIKDSLDQLTNNINKFEIHLSQLDDEQKIEFLNLKDLQRLMDERTTQIGRRQRMLFRWAFTYMMENNFENIRMIDAWLAHTDY